MDNKQQEGQLDIVSRLMQLESLARAAHSKEALSFMIVNETRKLLPYRQAYLFLSRHPVERDCELVAASSVAVIEEHSPFVVWLNKMVSSLFTNETINKQHQVDQSQCPDKLKDGWEEFSLPFVLWTPLRMPDGTFVGGFWLTRETPWQENELALTKRLAETYAHAMITVTSRPAYYSRPTRVKMAIWVIVLFLFAVLAKPIRINALAPAEVVAIEPAVVSAPMDGVVSDIYVSPNKQVYDDDVLFKLEDSELQNQFNVAQKTLAVAEAELRKASQDAFQDSKSNAEVALLSAEVELQRTRMEYAKKQLEKINVTAERSGVLIYSSKSDWIGRPVMVGERIMEVADPDRIQLQIELPVGDAIVLEDQAAVEVFLDADPLNPIPAVLTNSSYRAAKSESDVMSYRLYARFDEAVDPNELRIGLQGTAKVYGERVSLFFYLFRRPISAVRQFFGI